MLQEAVPGLTGGSSGSTVTDSTGLKRWGVRPSEVTRANSRAAVTVIQSNKSSRQHPSKKTSIFG